MKLETLQAELTKIDRRRAKLEQQIKSQSEALYTSLPRKVGLKNVDTLVMALAPYTSPAIRKKLQAQAEVRFNASPRGRTMSPKSAGTRTARVGDKRVRYSEEKKAAVRSALQDGKLTTSEISAKHGVPTDSVKKWKRDWGLTKARKKSK